MIDNEATTIWERWDGFVKDGQFHLTVTVPANTTAEILFPGGGETITVGSGVHKFVQ